MDSNHTTKISGMVKVETLTDAESDALADAIASIPAGERREFIDHVIRLARMKPGKRTAVYTLTE